MTEKNTHKRKRLDGMVVRLADQAAETIKRMIIENSFSPWEPLSESHLAEKLKVSRTPVREALTQLVQEGLLKLIPGKGAFVAELTIEDFREINALRFVLEPLAGETAVRNIPREKIDEQKTIWGQIAEDLKAGRQVSIVELTEADEQLHRIFRDYCNNSRLRNFLEVLRGQMIRYVRATWETGAFMQESVGQHLEILHAAEKKDVFALRCALEKHIDFNITVYTFRSG